MSIISIIIPCFNHGVYIDDAINSIQLEKYQTLFEVIIVDDGSTDPYTIEKMAFYEERGIKIIRQPNQGLAKARNNGIKTAKGKYILPLDSDNKIIPEVFIEAADILEKNNNISVVHTHAIYFGEKEGIWQVPNFDLRKIVLSNRIDACALIRKEILFSAGLYSTDMPIMGHEDWELWIKIGKMNETFFLLNKPGFYYRVTKNSMVNVISTPNYHKTLEYIFSKHFFLIADLFQETLSDNNKRIYPDDYIMIAKRVSTKTLLKAVIQKVKRKFQNFN